MQTCLKGGKARLWANIFGLVHMRKLLPIGFTEKSYGKWLECANFFLLNLFGMGQFFSIYISLGFLLPSHFKARRFYLLQSILKYILLELLGLCNASPPTVLPLES